MTTPEPTGTPEYPPPRQGYGTARTLAIVAFVLAGIAVIFAPPVLGIAAVVLGIIAHSKGDPLGRWAIAAGVAGAVLGIVLAAVVLSTTDEAAALVSLVG